MRVTVSLVAIVLAVLFIVLLRVIFPEADPNNLLSDLLIDQSNRFFIQDIMWVVFFLGLSELYLRWLQGGKESDCLNSQLLPQSPEVVLQKQDLRDIYLKLHGIERSGFLPRLIQRVILQIQISNSAEQGMTILNSSLDLFIHEIDLRYNILCYIMWLIPTLGFIGTVLGISDALTFAGSFGENQPVPLDQLTRTLGVAFFTTLLALLMAGILVFMMHIVQSKEEKALNSSGQYCIDNLINRLLLKKD